MWILLLKDKTIGKYSRFFRYLRFCFYNLTSPKGVNFDVILHENENGDPTFSFRFWTKISKFTIREFQKLYVRFYLNLITLQLKPLHRDHHNR